jgi:hypothetical protein
MPQADRAIPDASEAYRRWDELFRVGLRMALSGSDGPCEAKLARLVRSQQRRFAERDAMWARIVEAMKRAGDGR